jgi:hypothetical protein
MRTISDKPNGIILNHDGDWSGEACIGWYVTDRSPLHECWCDGPDLVAGKFTKIRGIEPPISVITRAVALAVESYFRSKMTDALETFDIDDLSSRRGKA